MRRLLLVAALAMTPSLAVAQDAVRLYAAGSLRAALSEVSEAFTRDRNIKVAGTFGPSGLLRERIEKGEPAEVFASADMNHPERLAKAGRTAGAVRLFVRNSLCALSRAELGVTSANLLERILDPKVKLGTSTPKADPSGDYAWLLFERAEKVKPGSFAKLDAKALKLTGGPNSPPPPQGRSAYGKVMEDRLADIFLTYCTNAIVAAKEVPGLQTVSVPDNLAVGADYGLVVLKGARPEADRFAAFILSQAGQQILARHGFSPAAKSGS